MQDEVKVSQAARDAAADLYLALDGGSVAPSDIAYAETVRQGRCDDSAAVQAFARHRAQAERETLARMEPVAWMYVRKVDAWPAAPNVLSNERWPANDSARPFWNEFALYALPPAPEAGQ